MKRRKLSLAWALAGLALVASAMVPTSGAFASSRSDETSASSSDSSEHGNASTRKPRTVPHWTSSFTDPTNVTTYRITMVGSDPRLGESTTVATRIIPLRFTFVAGGQDVSALNNPRINYFPTPLAVSMDGADNVPETIASPIFTPAAFPISGDSGVQYGDAFARAQFGKVGTGYHVILGQPRVAEAVSFQVPESKGVAVANPAPFNTVLVGRVDATWFRERLAELIDDMNLKPTILPIFLTNNVVLYQDANYSHCCIFGAHGAGSPASSAPISLAGKDKIRTFVYAAYLKPNTLPRFPAPYAGFSDINSLSHEIAEWIDDPFGINVVNQYRVPSNGTCGSELEIGDPLAGVWFPIAGNPDAAAGNVWHPQDEIFLNWFARDGEDPGLAPADGRYTYMGSMTTGIAIQVSPTTFIHPYAGFGQIAQAC